MKIPICSTRRCSVMLRLTVVTLAFALSSPERLSAGTVEVAKEGFAPTGWMGDGTKGQKYIKFEATSHENPYSGTSCQKWIYTKGDDGWASVAWQYPANNWGEKPGRKLAPEVTRLTWYARGAKGGEEIEFFSGGNTDASKTYQSSLEKASTNATLTQEWKQYSLQLNGDKSSVACAFGWSLQGSDSPITFYLQDIRFETSDVAQAPSAAIPVEGSDEIGKMGFVSSGWMGDGEQGAKYLKVDENCKDNPHSSTACQKWIYETGNAAWAGVAWQFPAHNWGDKAGKNLSASHFTKLTFFVRGAKGGDEVEFFSGGNSVPGKAHQASYDKVSKSVALTPDWQKVTIDLPGKDMSSVISAFGWTSDHAVIFYLDDIRFE